MQWNCTIERLRFPFTVSVERLAVTSQNYGRSLASNGCCLLSDFCARTKSTFDAQCLLQELGPRMDHKQGTAEL